MLGSEFKEIYNPAIRKNNKQAYYDDFMISFMPYHENGMGPDSEDGETSLCYNNKYLILNGDWCLAYSEIAPRGLEICIDFFKSKADMFKSSWSNEP